MDVCSGNRSRSRIPVTRKTYSLVPRDTLDSRGQDAQFCNRIGCSGRLKYSNSAPDCAEKPKYLRPSSRPSNGKEIVESTLRTGRLIPSSRNSALDSPRKLSSHLETQFSKSCGVQVESNVKKLIPATRRNQTKLQPEMRASRAAKVMPTEGGSSSIESGSSIGSNNACKRVIGHKPKSGCQNTVSGPCISSTESNIGSTRNNSIGSRNGLRNIKCNSISDVVPRRSLSQSKIRKDVLKKGSPGVESSLSYKGKRGSVTISENEHASSSISGISFSGSRRRNWTSNNCSSALSVRTRRPPNANSRFTSLTCENNIASSVGGSKTFICKSPRPEIDNSSYHTSPYQSSIEALSNASSSYSHSGRTAENVPGMASFTSIENIPGLRHHNLNAAAEVLLAFERIEQDEELTYEQLLVLENNLFFGNLYLYDQHREMRLDIDNMSYEELLALGDRMGTVSTALSDEAFAKYVKKTSYQTTSLEVRVSGLGEDEADIKCSVCQEEYAIGDEIGKLECEHGYHVACLRQWLRLKNWCPVCKAAAAPSEPSIIS